MSNHKVLVSILTFILILGFTTGCENDKMNPESADSSFKLHLKTQDQLIVMTRSGETPLLTAPEAGEFKVRLLNPGNKVLKEWEHYSEVEESIRIQTGTFILKATHGEQHTGAFSQPCFEGTTTFSVRKYEQTDVTVTCTLANIMTSVDYTEGFKHSFKDYQVRIASSGDPLIFNKEEKRAAFFEPGSLSVIIDVTKADGTTFSLPAAQIDTTKAQQYYRFHFDVAGEAGGQKILVSFDETTIDQPIEIDLAQNWIPGAAPFCTLTGFTSGQALETLEGESLDADLYALITARAKIKSCKLKTTSDLLIRKGWPGKEIELTTADSETREKLRNLGLKWTERMIGLNMAKIDFTHVFPNLPADQADENHTFTIETTDELGQVLQQPIVLNIITSIPSFTLHPHADVWVKTNGMNLNLTMLKGSVDEINLHYYNSKTEEWEVIPYTVANSTGNQHTLNAQVDFNAPEAKLKAVYGQSSRNSEIDFQVLNPIFEVAANGLPWAKRIQITAGQTNGNVLYTNAQATDFKVMVMEDGAAEWKEIPFQLTVSNPLKFDLKDLTPETLQSLKIVYDGGIGAQESENIANFQTESTLQLANSGFEEWTDLPINNVSEGGRKSKKGILGGATTYEAADKVTVISYKTGEDEQIWATLNAKTANASATNLNTWYVNPSTEKSSDKHFGSYAACISNVGWHNAGAAVQDNTPTSFVTMGGTPNPPSNLNRSAGKLFLGSYIAATDTENEGISFASRPDKIKFYYKYLPKPNDKDRGMVRASLKASDGTVIASAQQSLGSQSEYGEFTLTLTYSDTSKKAATICLLFSSSDGSIGVETSNNTSECIAVGSELYIDDLELIYE